MVSNEDASAAIGELIRQQSAEVRQTRASIPLNIDEAWACGEADLRDKVVVVTGAGSGFGKGFSLKAGQFGAKVVLSDLRKESAQKVADEIASKGGQATAIACNVTKWEDQVKMFRHARDTFGHVDIVVANAGIAEPPTARFLDFRTENGEPTKPALPTVDVNLIGLMYTTKLAFFHMRENPAKDGKSIVLLGSMASFLGIPGAPAYGATKHAVLGLMRSLYFDAHVYGIRINTVHPFFVKTNIFGLIPTLLLTGIPLPTVDDVVAAITAAACKVSSNGAAFVVDFKGILEIPYSASASEENGGYYAIFARRAQGALSLGKYVFDIVAAFSGALSGRRPLQ
ncbi:short-chain dehydrogenase/reductase SDR family protein [Rhodotorula toruloides]|uniref:Short-chain dehydrogenase/reductase SDR family protein n=1 Tax=Rhodotorula toruloides TaxID=5286 RepID=A0A511KA55_RHOTO|nr:short-chain dehydrogenase/reductase SDR family protein [Rhodotorula toruloides]